MDRGISIETRPENGLTVRNENSLDGAERPRLQYKSARWPTTNREPLQGLPRRRGLLFVRKSLYADSVVIAQLLQINALQRRPQNLVPDPFGFRFGNPQSPIEASGQCDDKDNKAPKYFVCRTGIGLVNLHLEFG